MRAKILNEEHKSGSIWRSTDQKWLIIFLEKGEIYPIREDGFISLSFDSESGGMDSFGGRQILIEFDDLKIMDQGAEPIDYDIWYMNENPKISLYVTGYPNGEAYEEDHEVDEDMYELSWETFVEDFAHEEEIILTHLKLVPGLIKNVIFYKEPEKILIDLLEKNNISYEISKI